MKPTILQLIQEINRTAELVLQAESTLALAETARRDARILAEAARSAFYAELPDSTQQGLRVGDKVYFRGAGWSDVPFPIDERSVDAVTTG